MTNSKFIIDRKLFSDSKDSCCAWHGNVVMIPNVVIQNRSLNFNCFVMLVTN